MSKNYFDSCREVKWCPGCGNHSILMAMQKNLFSLGLKNENVVFISGIGCSGRFPYYINTYGFHTLHGRAPAVATGLAMTRPDLTIWLVIGDGDGFSIGLGHVLHMIRRNININVLFINNGIYGLTKGQYSPTSMMNTITKSSPDGSIEKPINPLLLALTAGATFVARVIDIDKEGFKDIISESLNHKGISFIEVLQNCNVFNDKIHSHLKDKKNKLNRLLYLKHNKYLDFGDNSQLSLQLSNDLTLNVSENINNKDKIIYKSDNKNILQTLLAEKTFLDIPFPVGIFRSIKDDTYEDLRMNSIKSKKKIKISDISNSI